MIYGIAHEMMQGGDAPDHAFREYGTDRWSEQEYDIDRDHESYQYERPHYCEWCSREVEKGTLVPFYGNEADPTYAEYICTTCNDLIHKSGSADTNEEEVPF